MTNSSTLEREAIAPVLLDRVPYQEVTPSRVMSYKAFQRLSPDDLETISTNTLVRGVRAGDLWTPQRWLELEKAKRASNDFERGRCLTTVLAYPQIIRDRLGLILDNGNHRAGLIIANELGKIDVLLKSPALCPFDTRVIRPLRALVREYLGLLRIWD